MESRQPNRKKKPHIVKASFIAVALCLLAALPLCAETLTGKVVKVADGNTVTVLDGANGQHRIRLEKIDAPEKQQAFGNASRKHLAGMITGRIVEVTYAKRDRYGRILGVIRDGEVEVNLKMVQDGLAWHYKHYDKSPVYAEAETVAREKKLGLWKDPNPLPPWEFRKQRRQP